MCTLPIIGRGVRVHPFNFSFWRHFLCVSQSWTVIFVCYLVCTQENYLPVDTICERLWRIVLPFGNVVCTLPNFLPEVPFSDIDIIGQCFFPMSFACKRICTWCSFARLWYFFSVYSLVLPVPAECSSWSHILWLSYQVSVVICCHTYSHLDMGRLCYEFGELTCYLTTIYPDSGISLLSTLRTAE